MDLTSNTAVSRALNVTLKFARTLSIGACCGSFAWLLFPAVASAQPEFCLNGVIWQSVTDVPSAPARELTISQRLALGSQILFGSPRLRDELLVSAHDAATCQRCHQPAEHAGDETTQDPWADSELVVIRPSARNGFWQPDYEAFRVRGTTVECQVETKGVLGGAPTVNGLLGHHESDSDIRFIIESNSMVGALNPDTASVLVTPDRGSATPR